MRWCTIILAALVAEACACTDLLTYAVQVTVRDAQAGDTLVATVFTILIPGVY